MITFDSHSMAIDEILIQNKVVLLYFSNTKCNVCQVLKPKLDSTLSKQFPRLIMVDINIENNLQITSQLGIFSAPTAIIYIEGKESYRYSRNISITELSKSLERPYTFLF